jgi:hypothetical protein
MSLGLIRDDLTLHERTKSDSELFEGFRLLSCRSFESHITFSKGLLISYPGISKSAYHHRLLAVGDVTERFAHILFPKLLSL